jgi:hypothetical protein
MYTCLYVSIYIRKLIKTDEAAKSGVHDAGMYVGMYVYVFMCVHICT